MSAGLRRHRKYPAIYLWQGQLNLNVFSGVFRVIDWPNRLILSALLSLEESNIELGFRFYLGVRRMNFGKINGCIIQKQETKHCLLRQINQGNCIPFRKHFIGFLENFPAREPKQMKYIFQILVYFHCLFFSIRALLTDHLMSIKQAELNYFRLVHDCFKY